MARRAPDEHSHTLIDLAAGETLGGRYELVQELGRGGMGVVWLAADRTLDGRKIAIKILPTMLSRSPRAIGRLKGEATTCMELAHPHIVRLYNFEQDAARGDLAFIVMQYVNGKSLDDMLADYPVGLDVETAVRWITEIASAIDYAHQRGILHRDVKPSNIMVDKDGHAFLMDFGIARETKDTLTRITGRDSTGTLPYMSPQHVDGLNHKSNDIYSLAATAYEVLSGKPPFHTGEIYHQIKQSPVPPIGRVPAPVNAALARGLAKTVEDRVETAMQFARELAGEAGAAKPKRQKGAKTGAKPAKPAAAGAPGAGAAPARRRRLLLGAGAAALVLVVAVPLVGVVAPGSPFGAVARAIGLRGEPRGVVEPPGPERPDPTPSDAGKEAPQATPGGGAVIEPDPTARSPEEPPRGTTGEVGAPPPPAPPPPTLVARLKALETRQGDLSTLLPNRASKAVAGALGEADRHRSDAERHRAAGRFDEADGALTAMSAALDAASSIDAHLGDLDRVARDAGGTTWEDDAGLKALRQEIEAELGRVRADLDRGATEGVAERLGEMERRIVRGDEWSGATAARRAFEEAGRGAPPAWYDKLGADVQAAQALAAEAAKDAEREEYAAAASGWREARTKLASLRGRHEEAAGKAQRARDEWQKRPVPGLCIRDDGEAGAHLQTSAAKVAAAEAALREGRFDEVGTSYAEAAEAVGSAERRVAALVEGRTRSAEASRSAGRFAEAVAGYEALSGCLGEVETKRELILTYVSWAKSERDAGKVPSAQEKVAKALEIDPKHPEAGRLRTELEQLASAASKPPPPVTPPLPVTPPTPTHKHLETMRNGIGLDLVYLSDGAPGRAFWMGATEVTQGQWTAVMGTTIDDLSRPFSQIQLRGKGADHPVCFVSRAEAEQFCAELSRRENQRYRLPTAAEWEYAARAGGAATYGSYGNTLGRTHANVNFTGNQQSARTKPARSYDPNAWGLYDMLGNVEEWVSSGPAEGGIAKGGSFNAGPESATVGFFVRYPPTQQFNNLGFRVVCE